MPMSWRVLKQVKKHASKSKPADLIFPMNQDNFAVKFGRVMTRLEIDDLHFHDLRHEATSEIAKIFESPLMLKRVTGHLDLKSLDRYFHPNMSEMAMLAERKRKG